MKQVIPLNSLRGGQISPTITAHYHKVAWSDLSPVCQLPHIAIMEIIPCNEATSTPPYASRTSSVTREGEMEKFKTTI